jgi:succinate dehydrogenase / fumarate reductase cytochrome b subunit
MDKPSRPPLLAVTKKIIMAVTGLGLCLFLVGHLAGNTLLLFPGQDGRFNWFNTYARTLNAIPVLLLIELGLVAMFLLHAYEGLMVWKQNKAARPVEYQGGREWTRAKSNKSRKSLSSTMMMTTGTVILLFAAMHIWHFKYHHSIGPANPISSQRAGENAPAVGVTGAGVAATEPQSANETVEETEDLAMHVVYEFKKPYVSIIYMLCMIALGLHLNHAVWSAFQTLGATGSKMRRFMVGFGRVFAIVIAGGFFILPLWAWFFVEVPK